jgi:uncharacterized LabA/DUF88 family protein
MLLKSRSQRIAVFVDVANMYYSAKNLYQTFVNFGEVLKSAVAGRQLIRAFAYVIRAYIDQEKSFFEALQKQGFEVRVKDLQVFPGGMKKGDWDVGLCMDAVTLLPKIDTMVLVSGDGDYVDLLDYVRSHGVRTEVMAFGRTTAGKLIEHAHEFTDLDATPARYLIRPSRSSRPRTNHVRKS